MKKWLILIAIFVNLFSIGMSVGAELPDLRKNSIFPPIPLIDRQQTKIVKNDFIRERTIDDLCLTPECIHTASRILKNLDLSVDPCDNFYDFACGGYVNSTIIPDDKSVMMSFISVQEKLYVQLRTLVEDENQANETKPFRLAKNLYKSCMNKTSIESQDLEPFRKILKSLGGWPVLDGKSWNENDFDWKRTIYKFRDAGQSTDYFIRFDVITDSKNNTRRVIGLDEPSFGLDREYLQEGFENVIVQAYYKYMVDIAVVLGAERNNAMIELKESLLFEIQLANITLADDEKRDAEKLYNRMTLKELIRNYPMVSWREYFTRLLGSNVSLNDDEVAIVAVPSYFEKLAELMKTPKRIQANYVMWRITADNVNYLNNEIRKIMLAYSTSVYGPTEEPPKWKECISVLHEHLALSLSAMYVRKHFNAEMKKNAVEMVMGINQQFEKTLQQVEWLDEKTRQYARQKAVEMSSAVAYPDELMVGNELENYYENLELSENNYLQNIMNITRFFTNYMFGQLRKPVNKNDWTVHGEFSALVNAAYFPEQNTIEIPAGILQDDFFKADRPKYMNYGAIGQFVGHEMTHGFDDEGRQYDKNGNLSEWWTSSTREKFLEHAKCFINQYGNYTDDDVKLPLNGVNTQGENIADNGGIRTAYLAYIDWAEKNLPEKELPGLHYNPRQMFWISVANTWCTKSRPEILKYQIINDLHSPSKFRVNGALSNMNEFSNDFKCLPNSKMNREKKCSLW